VAVNAQTAYSGSAQSFSQLRAGMFVEVRGTIQSDGTVVATQVISSTDN
jgi:hypothetical protein